MEQRKKINPLDVALMEAVGTNTSGMRKSGQERQSVGRNPGGSTKM